MGNERPVESAGDEEASLARISAASKPPVRSGMPVCGRLTASVGMASALSSTRYSWNFVGSSAPVAFTGSPAVSLSCESGSAPGRVFESFIGMESAPFLRYFGTGDSVLHHFGTVSGGLMVGSDTLRAGPIGTAGIWVLGGGARVAAGLHTDRQGLRHVLELRSQMLYQGAPSGHFMLMYGVSFDPWRDPVFRER